MANAAWARMAWVAGMFLAELFAAAATAPAQTLSTLLSFEGSDGLSPEYGSLVQGIDGNYYGTTLKGGATFASDFGHGTIFRITPGGELTTLYSFCSKANCADGEYPVAGLVQAANGGFYGTTEEGGTGNSSDCGNLGCGTVFAISPSGRLTTLYSFCSQPDCTDGNTPYSGLVQGGDGNLYGTTYYGGTNYFGIAGTVFKITPTGELTTLYSFCAQANCADGSGPMKGLVEASNGNFYGTTSTGGAHDHGTIFEITREGKLTTLHSFSASAGANAMIEVANGDGQADLYGTTFSGGAYGDGTVFKMNAAGELITLYSFCSQVNLNEYCADGAHPAAGLVEGSDGNFYGTTSGGGAAGQGTIFEITPAGNLTTLYSFCAQNSTCTDGSGPWAGLLQATNGTFYGTTPSGGGSANCFSGCGSIFSLSMQLRSFVQVIPGFGKVGRYVRILGDNLTGATGVSFNGTPARFEVVSATDIEAIVPHGATSGTIKVMAACGTISGNVGFQVVP